MITADYFRWLHREERFTLPEIRRYLARLSMLECALILYCFARGGGRGAMAADAVVDVVRGLEGRLVAFRRDRRSGAIKIWVRRGDWLEQACLPAHFPELPRVELRHLLVAEFTRRSGRHARLQVVRARYAARLEEGAPRVNP